VRDRDTGYFSQKALGILNQPRSIYYGGFPSKDRIKEKDEKPTEGKWEKFLGYYNSIKPLDMVFFQVQNSEKKFYIHAT
jgi:hypothetical protein